MLRQNDRRAKLPVDLAESRQKIRRGNGVKLARRLVENQHFWLQDHNGSEIQELLLPTGQLCDRLVKPFLNPEKRCHFRNSAANRRRIVAEGFQPERQLVPDLVGRDLIFRTLLHKADLLGLFALGQFIELLPIEQNFTGTSAMWREDGFELPQQRTFAAPGGAAEHQKLPRSDRQCEVGNRVLFLFRIRKIQVSDCKDFHCLSSFRSRITGVRTSARYTNMKLIVNGVHKAVLTVG